MWKFRRSAAALCLLGCLTLGMAPQALAVQADEPGETDIMPCMLYIDDSGCSMRIANGKATAKANVIGISETTKAKVVVSLQEKSGSGWKTVKTWTGTKDSARASASGSKAVTAGKTYRAQATVTVWVGSKSESRTITSGEKKA